MSKIYEFRDSQPILLVYKIETLTAWIATITAAVKLLRAMRLLQMLTYSDKSPSILSEVALAKPTVP